MKIPRSLRADIRRTYSFGLVANLGMPGDAQARWSRFREAAKHVVAAGTWEALEVAWSATEQGRPAPEKVVSAPVESAPFKVGDRVRIVHQQPRPYRDPAPLGWEGRISNVLPDTRDPFWVAEENGATGWWCKASELEHMSAPAPARSFKVGDRVRVVRLTCTDENISQLQPEETGEITAHDASGRNETERRQCWRVRSDSGSHWPGWHADDELELVTTS